MRVFNHPVHPMLVHFPIAFWSLATVCDGCALFGLTQAWTHSWILIALGLGLAVPAMLAGLIDLAGLDDEAMPDGNRHMLLMSAAWTFYLGALLMRLDGKTPMLEIQPLSVALGGMGFIVMALGGWYGGQLVYHHGTGVDHK